MFTRHAAQFAIILLTVAICACFPQRAGSRLQHFRSEAPPVGTMFPHARLYDAMGQRISLDEYIGDRPLVVQLGSHSCPVYRYRRFGMSKLYEKYKDRVQFLLVYTLEAHPAGDKSPYAEDEWLTLWNRIPGVRIPQHTNLEQRTKQAAWSAATLGVEYPVLVDDMDNSAWTTLGRASSPAFVVDQDGRIILRQVWLDPAKIERAIKKMLDE